MPKPIPFREFRRYFEKYGVEFQSRKTGGSHCWMMVREIQGVVHKFPIALISGREILDVYIKPARRKLKLSEDDGLTDEEFFS